MFPVFVAHCISGAKEKQLIPSVCSEASCEKFSADYSDSRSSACRSDGSSETATSMTLPHDGERTLRRRVDYDHWSRPTPAAVAPQPARTPALPRRTQVAGPAAAMAYVAPQVTEPFHLLTLLTGKKWRARKLCNRLDNTPGGWLWLAAHLPSREAAVALKACYNDYKRLSGKPLVALVLACGNRLAVAGSGHHTRQAVMGPSTAQRAFFLQGFKMLQPDECRALALALFADPQTAARLSSAFAVQERLELYQRGDSYTTFSAFTWPLLHAETPLPDASAAARRMAQTPYQITDAPRLPHQPQTCCGRTVYLETAKQGRLGIKLEKKDGDALAHEDVMDQCFALWQQELGLMSAIPRSLGMTRLSPPPALRRAVQAQAMHDGRATFALGMSDRGQVAALVYQAPQDYHLHLHEARSLAELRQGSHRCMVDTGRIAAELGLLSTSPADMYHNSEKMRRYHWNVDFLHRAVGSRAGAGRLDQWENAIRTLNLGVTGCRDFKHYAPIDAWADTLLADVGAATSAAGRALTVVSSLGDVLLAHSLAVGKWFLTQDKMDDTELLASVLRDSFAALFSAYSGRPLGECVAFLAAVVHFARMAAQMRYFLARHYVADVAANTVPQALFEPGCTVLSAVPQEGWHARAGWMVDGKNSDLGPKNGPLPLTELIRGIHLTTGFAVATRRTPAPAPAAS